jgi:anti-sigma regulatory factor (Ser/Thr protein kinase)
MKVIVICLLSFILISDCFSQAAAGPADSLKKVLQSHSAPDTGRVWLLIKLSTAIFTSTPDEAMQYADEAIALSEKIHWKKGIAVGYKCKGNVELVRFNYTTALDHYQKALANDPKESKMFEAVVLGNIGVVYDGLNEYEKAVVNYRKLLVVATEMNNKESQTMALSNIGDVYTKLKVYDSALYYFDASLVRAKEINNNRLICNVYCTLGGLYRDMGKYKEALDYSAQSVKLAEESGNLYVKAPALNNLAMANFYLGHYYEAEKYNKLSLEISKELNSVQWQSESWNELFTNYEKQGKTEQALEAYKNFITLRDSVNGDEKRQELIRKEAQYQSEKKEALLKVENEARIEEERLTRNGIVAIAAILLIVGLISFAFYKKRRDAVTKQKEAELKAAISDTEMKALRAQMNPHFIFNSLNSISDYIAKNNTKAADEYLVKFAKLMRLILENSEQKMVSLAEDLDALELYMQLEALRLKNKFTYSIQVDDALDKDATLVPPLILQPFVENSIWHGIAGKDGEGHIAITIKKEGGMINCIVEDNGVGRQGKNDVSNLKDNSGKRSLGMKITKERIDIINKTKKTNAVVTVTDLEQGIRVEVKLPLELNY